ncbi:MAG: histidine kinase dimerization/phospho-acceptor domain-containing protein, partial [Gemmatimonadaceae bacterium]
VLNWGKDPHVYHPGDAIEGVWYAVWVVKWVAARYALDQARRPNAPSRQRLDEYPSTVMPHVFLVAATAVLLFQLVNGNRQDSTLFLFGSGSLAALLVARHAVELRERDRLHRHQLAEETWYRALLHHAYDFVALLDANGTATYVSPATTRLLGDTAPLYRPWGLVAAAHPDDAERLKAALTAPDLHAAPVTLACRVRDAAGGWRDMALRLHDLKADPLVAAIVVNGHDLTRESRLSQRLRESEEVEALGIFAGGLAHDLNNILTVIGSHVDLLQSEPVAEVQAKSDLRAIRVATDRAATLTRGLLALSRRKAAPREAVDVGALVRERLDAQRNTRDWPVTMQASGRTVNADPLSLSQVVDSILNDAALDRRSGLSPLTLATRVVDADDARGLEIEPGTYVVLNVGKVSATNGVAVPVASLSPKTGAEWDASPDDLGMLMALAAVREVGGTLTLESDGEERLMSVYLPSALV